MRQRAKIVASLLVLSAFAGAAPAAFAETDDRPTVEPIIVTAAKREQNVQDVPISMNVVSQSSLEAYDTADLRGLANLVPNLVVLRSNSINTISLRGFGSSAANPAIDQTVALYTDGVFAGRARQYMAPFFDVARVEVLRGPQGALLGKNTAAGAVSIVTNNPTPTFEGAITASYLFDRKGIDTFGYISGPLAPTLTARLAFKFIHDSGWVLNLATGDKDPRESSGDVRLGLTWEPSDTFQMITKLQYDNLNVDGRAMAGFPASLPSSVALQAVKRVTPLAGLTDFDRQRGYHASVTATARLGGLTLVSVSGYEGYDSDSLASASHADPVTFTTRFQEHFQQISQELRLVSPSGGKFEWIVGGYVDRSWHKVDNVIRYAGLFVIFNLNGQMTSNYGQYSTSLSAFATGTWHATDQLRLIVGARYSYDHKNGSYVLGRDFGQNFIGSAPTGPLVGALTDQHFDPSVTVQYDVTPRVMTYLSYSRGSKGGTFQGANRSVTADTFQLKPEESTNYEAGLKSQISDWLTFNASIYRLEFKNLQAGQYVNGVLLTKNAGAARSQGVELVAEASWRHLTLDLSAAYTDAKYTDYPGAPCTQAQIDTGCVNGVTPVNATGRAFAFVPKWSGRASATYSTPIGERIKASLNAAVTFNSSYFVDAGAFNPFFGLQPSFAKVDLRAELADRDDRWSVALVGKNVNNILTNGGVYPWPFNNPPLAVYTLDDLRSISLQVGIKF